MRLDDVLQDAMAAGEPQECILCGEPTENRGAFQPNDSSLFGAPPDKQRLLIYALCEREARTQDVYKRVENVILGKLILGDYVSFDATL